MKSTCFLRGLLPKRDYNRVIVTFIVPTNFLQWNVQGLRPKKHQVLQAIIEVNLDVVLLQETLIPAVFHWRVAGYTLHSLPTTVGGAHGCAMLVRSSIPHHRTTNPVYCGDGVEVLAVELQVGGRWFSVYNLYRSQRHCLDSRELLTLASHTSLLVGGDFNAHHPRLHSVLPTNTTGRHLSTLLEEIPHIKLLNTREATHTRGGRLDLTLVSGDLTAGATWQVHPTLTSVNYATLTTLTVTQLVPPRHPHGGTPGGRIGSSSKPSLTSGGALTSHQVICISRRTTWRQPCRGQPTPQAPRAAVTAPTGGSTTRQSENTTTESMYIGSCTKSVQPPPTWGYYRTWWHVCDKCLSRPERTSGWNGVPLSTNTPLSASCGEMWGQLLVQPRPAYLHQEAESLINFFTAWGSSAQLPPYTRHLQQQLRLHQDEAVRRHRK